MTKNGHILKPFPKYSNFTQFTPELPKFYWDVYSQEERLKAICFEINKLIEFLDSIVDTINAQYAEMEELEQELRELAERCQELLNRVEEIIAGLEEWKHQMEEEWAEFREEITQELADFEERLNQEWKAYKDAIEEWKEQTLEDLNVFRQEIVEDFAQLERELRNAFATWKEQTKTELQQYIVTKVAEELERAKQEIQQWIIEQTQPGGVIYTLISTRVEELFRELIFATNSEVDNLFDE